MCTPHSAEDRRSHGDAVGGAPPSSSTSADGPQRRLQDCEGQRLPDSIPVFKIADPSSCYTGTIPTEFGLLTGVTYLDLRENQLTGSIPTGPSANYNRPFKPRTTANSNTDPTQIVCALHALR